MGFGTLFIGYFLLLNVTYFGYTDLIAGLIMLMGLYKLSTVNKQFKFASFGAALFSLFGTAELFVSIFSMFKPSFKEETVLLYITPIRYVVIALFSFYILLGIKEIAGEVKLRVLKDKANFYIYVSLTVFLLAAIFDLPLLNFMPAKALAIISVFLLLFIFFIVGIILSIIYKAYMKICMPSDLNQKADKKSKFDFVNKFREHEVEKQKEYAQYKLSKMQNKGQSHNKKKGKKK